MQRPSVVAIRATALDLLASATLELVMGTVIGRLDRGRENGRPHVLRRVIIVVLQELVAETASAMYWERRRLRAAVDQRLAAQQHAVKAAPQVPVPGQRQPSPAERGPRSYPANRSGVATPRH